MISLPEYVLYSYYLSKDPYRLGRIPQETAFSFLPLIEAPLREA